MVSWIYILLTALFVHAENDSLNRGQYPFDDPEIGRILVVVADVEETRDVLNFYYRCYDKRLKPTEVKPEDKWLQVPKLTDVPVCLFRPRADLYDAVNKIANVRFSRFKIHPGRITKCEIHENAIVDLRRLCHAWQPPN